jgi:hypothetical protein
VRIDSTHRKWLVASAVILGVSAVLYAIYRVPASAGSMGGTVMGLAFGVTGFGFMIFAGLLGARKKVPVWRVGRAQMWMRGHLWLGLLSLPLILFHAGFHTGGPLTTVLIWLLVIVVASGLFGAILQHYLPTVMTREAPLETIYDEMDHVNAQLRQEAAELVERAGARSVEDEEGVTIAVEEQAAPLHNFFAEQVRPFLANNAAKRGPLSDASLAERSFAQLKRLLPPELHATVNDLEDICEEHRQLTRQARLHRWMHGWLLVHIPLSLALLLLGAVHAVIALRY